MAQKANRTLMFVGFLVLIGVGFLLFQGRAPATITGTDAPSGFCDSTTTPTVTFTCTDFYKAGTSAAAGNTVTVIRESGTETHVDCDATAELNPDEEVTLQVAYNSSLTGVYGVSIPYTVECTENPTVEIRLPDRSDGSLTTTCFNSDDGSNINAAGDTDTVAANGEEDVECTVKVVSEDWFGNPSFAICPEFNTSNWDEFEIIGGTKVPKPSTLATTSGNTEECYEFDALQGEPGLRELDFTIHWETGSNYADENITVTYIDMDMFRNSDNREYQFDYEDNSNANVGLTDNSTFTYFTN